jgi:hypothetical protein
MRNEAHEATANDGQASPDNDVYQNMNPFMLG